MDPVPYSFIILDNQDQLVSTATLLQPFNVEIKTVKNLDEFRNHMVTIQVGQNRIILIVSGMFGYQLKPDFQNDSYPQIHSIYIYCQNKAFHQQWTAEIKKIKGVVVSPDELRTQVQENEFIAPQPAPIETAIAAPKLTETIQLSQLFVSEIDIKYTIVRLLINAFIRVDSNDQAKEVFAGVLLEMFKNNTEKTSICNEFLTNYSSNEPMRWVWRDRCFSDCLANVITTADPNAVQLSGFLFRDLMKQFERNQCTTTVEMYLGSRLPIANVEQLKQLRNRYIMFPSFLIGSNDQNVAISKATAEDPTDNSQGVIFTINADPTIVDAAVFAPAKSLGGTNLDNEYVFMVGSLFRINDVSNDPNGTTKVQMTLCGHDDNVENKSIYDFFKQTYADDQEYSYTKYLCLLADIGKQLEQPQLMSCAYNCGKSIVDSTHDEWEKMRCYDMLAMIDYQTGDVEAGIRSHKKSIDLKEKQSEMKDPSLAKSYEDIAQIYQAKGNFTEAIQHFQKALNLLNSFGAAVEPDLYISHARLATAYEADQKYKEALCSYLQAVRLIIQYDCDESATIGNIYHNTANMCQLLQMYPLAVAFYQSAIEAKTRAHVGADASFLSSYKNLGMLYRQLKENTKARECFEHALNIYKQLEMQDDTDFQETQQLINELTNST